MNRAIGINFFLRHDLNLIFMEALTKEVTLNEMYLFCLFSSASHFVEATCLVALMIDTICFIEIRIPFPTISSVRDL